MANQLVLIADDDAAVRRSVGRALAYEGMDILEAEDGQTALRLISSTPLDLVILDIMMSGADGFSVLQSMRQSGNLTPVIIVSGRTADQDAVFGLSIGADDYITKPFSPSVLSAKVKALLRRTGTASAKPQSQALEQGVFRFDLRTMKLYKSGVEIPLTGKEMGLCRLFLEQPGQVFSKEQLYRIVWQESAVDDNTIMVYIRRLRAKLEDNPQQPRYLKTIWGVGYQFLAE